MKRLFFLLFIINATPITAQINEIGVFLGGSNFIGDVGKTNYISPNEIAYGIIYKWNRSPRHAYRFSYMQSKITANDLNSKVPGRKQRGYNFENSIKEVTAGLEFNFFDFNLHQLDQKITPYVFTGLTYFGYNELFVLSTGTKIDYSESTFAIPMIVGIKSNIKPNIIVGFEVGARYTFTDNIDGSNPKNKNLEPLKFGNLNSNDWYVFSGFTLTYTFGEKPCYCSN
jgi:hypothetical protein